MRILPRLNMPTPKAARRLWRHTKAHLTLKRIYYSVEVLLFALIFFAVFSGGRLRFIDTWGGRMDTIVSILLFAIFIITHVVAHRRLLPKIRTLLRSRALRRAQDLLRPRTRLTTRLQHRSTLSTPRGEESDAHSMPATPRSSFATTTTGNFNLRV